MGCGNPEDDGASAPQRAPTLPKNFTPAPQMFLGRKGTAITRDYFVHNFNKTTKGNLTRQCKIWKGDHVLVAFSGGAASRVMLHLLQDWISDKQLFSKTGRKMFFQISVIFVDIGAAVGMDHEERRQKMEQARQICEAYGHKTACLTLEEAGFHGDEKALRDYLASFKTLSGREDALKQLIKRCILDQAVHMGIDKVAFGDSASQMAVNVIGDMAKGRGGTVPHTVAYRVRDPRTNVYLLRPMKDHTAKEIAIFRHIHGLQEVFYPDLTTTGDIKTASIDRLVESFVVELQTEFPSTIHTILRTTEKLKFPHNEDQNGHCVLCGCPLLDRENEQLVQHLRDHQPREEDCTSKKYTLEGLLNQLNIAQEKSNDGDQNHLAVKDAVTFAHFCCYGCKRVLSEKEGLQGIFEQVVKSMEKEPTPKTSDSSTGFNTLNLDSYPVFVSDSLVYDAKKLSRGQMREQLEEYLLDDENDEDDNINGDSNK